MLQRNANLSTIYVTVFKAVYCIGATVWRINHL